VSARAVLFALEGLPRPEALLAIVGGAALGALLAGWAARLLTRWMTARPAPRWLLVVVRVLGAIVLGLLVAVWVWNGGGWGPFGNGPGPGGLPGAGPSADTNHPAGPPAGSTDSGGKSPREKDEPPPTPETTLSVEVLTDAAVRRAAGDKAAGERAVKEGRYYRLADKDPKDLQTLDGIEDVIKRRKAEKPPLQQLLLVLTRDDGPGTTAKSVRQLYALGQQYGLNPDYSKP
jgi:hypothetical protein